MECAEFVLGNGVVLRSTYAHIMAPFIAAFGRPPRPGAAHPAPWKAVSGGIAHDVLVELFVPASFAPEGVFDRVDTAWWITALLRMKAVVPVSVPVIASAAFSDI